MHLFALDREHFNRLLSKGTVRDGDYQWSIHDMFDDDSVIRVYLRYHVSGVRTYWVVHDYDSERALMRAVRRVPVITHHWIDA